MSDPVERIHEEPATSEQATALFTEVRTVTNLRGKDFSMWRSYGERVTEVPAEVAAHLPEPTDPGSKITDSVNITQNLDPKTRQPLHRGVVGSVIFTRSENIAPNLTYAAHVNYHILTEDGESYDLERHVTNSEHGPHKTRGARQRLGRRSLGIVIAYTDRLVVRYDERTARSEEQAMGWTTVTKPEADDVIGFMRAVNDDQ